jgi:hypothetical protein
MSPESGLRRVGYMQLDAISAVVQKTTMRLSADVAAQYYAP